MPDYTFLASVAISPALTSIKGGLAQAYALIARFETEDHSDFEDIDVTDDPATVFSLMAPFGSLTGSNNHVCQSVVRHVYSASITGQFTGGSNNATVSDTATLSVSP